MKNKILVLTLATALLFVMSSCVFFVEEHEHQFGEEWVSDDSYHWHVCAGDECDEIADKAEHTGGTATETAKAKCEICGTEYGELKAHEHVFGEWEVKTPTTCTAAGEEVRACACGEEETKPIAQLEHSFGEWTIKTPATCTAAGEEVRACDCGEEETKPIAQLEHSFGEWIIKTPATCTAAGEEVRACDCGEEETKPIAQLEHSFVNEVVDQKYLATANCEEQATYFKSCACGEKGTETFAYGDVIAHIYGEWQTKTPANCNDAEVEYRACACGKEETQTGDVAALGHNMVVAKDDTHHWTECDRCDEATEKVAHEPTTLSVVSNLSSPMQYDVVKVSDLTVTAGCDCGAQIPVTGGIIFTEFALAEGVNTISVTFAGLTATTTVEAKKFGVVIDGKVTDDTYVYSGSGYQEKNYVDQKELSANGNNFRVLLRYNFSDFLASAYYQAHKTEAKVQFTFTMTTGTITTEDAITFKVYPTSADRSAVSFSSLTWKTYDDEPHALGWGNAYGFVEKVANNDKVAIDGDKITITVAYRELEQFIDADGNAIFVFAIWKSSTKVGSIENDTVANRPTVQVILNDEHIHAFINENVDEKYLVSANCTEKAKYLYSCSCGAASDKIFEYGEVIEHQFGEWQTRTEANCLEAELEFRVCACGEEETQTGDAALDHDMQTKFDETNHWTECSRCDEATAPVAHFGGEATETEQATCEGCGQKYGGLASHVHEFGEWQTRTEATCTEAEVEFRKCECGAEETQIGDAALGHNMETKYNDDNHWTECSRCDEATEAVAHFGGEATYTEQAICEGCSQPYGALKEVPKQEYTISGAIAEDTYVSSNSTSAKDADYSTSKDALGTFSTYYRAYFKFDLSSIINSEDYAACKGDAKIQFIFTLSKGAVTDSSKLTFGGFTPGANTTGLAFSNVTYNSVSSNGTYADLNWNSATTLVDGGKTVANNADKVSYTENTLTITLNYSDIEGMVDENGLVVFTLRIGSTSGISIASMENTTYAAPTVKFVYEK